MSHQRLLLFASSCGGVAMTQYRQSWGIWYIVCKSVCDQVNQRVARYSAFPGHFKSVTLCDWMSAIICNACTIAWISKKSNTYLHLCLWVRCNGLAPVLGHSRTLGPAPRVPIRKTNTQQTLATSSIFRLLTGSLFPVVSVPNWMLKRIPATLVVARLRDLSSDPQRKYPRFYWVWNIENLPSSHV